ncbi:MAG: transketolase C-terminal domain-containing protein [Candidatus Omnitrophota bacterium]
MRSAFIGALEKQAKKNPKIYLLVADLGFLIFDKFKKDFPSRFINLGIAEANMIGVAAGFALCGKTPFVYTIAPFVTARAFEQIRIDICYQNLNVKIVGVGGGFAYSSLGPTHHAIEDIATMRSLPNMTIVCPADSRETIKAVDALVNFKGPVYLRLVKGGEPSVYSNNYDFRLGKAVRLSGGDDVTIIATGSVVYSCQQALKILREAGIRVRLLNFHTIKPIDKDAILEAAKETRALVSVEEHNIIGGLGSAVAEVMAEESIEGVAFKRFGINDIFCKNIGSHGYLQKFYGLAPDCIADKVKKFFLSIK